MKYFRLAVLGSAILLGGCASTENSAQSAAMAGGDSYVALGSNIPKKGPRRTEDKTLDLQQLENQRTMNTGINNGQ